MAQPPIKAAKRVNRLRFGPHDRVTLGGRAYCRPKPTPIGWAFGRDDAPELTQELTHETIEAYTGRPGYRYERDYYAPTVSRQRSAGLAQSMDDVPRHKKPEVLFRFQVCHRFHRLCKEGVVTISDRGIAKALPIIAAEVALLECSKVRPTLLRTPKSALASPRASSNSETKRRGGRQHGIPTSGKPEISLRKMPPVSTFWKWWKKYCASERAPWGLKDNYGNCGGVPQPVCTEALAVLQQMAVDYGTREQPSKALLLERMRNRIFALNQNRADDVKVVCPSRKQLYDHLASLQNIRVVAGRKGGDAARRKCSPISQGMGIVLPLERVEMDHWEVHLQSVLVAIGLWDRLNRNKRRSIARMHLCVAIDVATKVILGMRLSETPTSADAIAVVQAIVSDKDQFADAVGAALPWDMHGTPETIATDGGAAFTTDDFGWAIASLRCDHIIPPGGVPSLRGTMERFFKTVHMRLISRFHGRTFENMLVRGDYPAEKLANLDTRDLAWVIVRWVVDVYHGSKHDGLGGATPRNAWLEAVELYGTTPPPDPHVRRSIFGIPLVRTLNQEGIRVLGVRYWSDALVEEFFNRGIVEIEIKLDPADIGEISVRIGRDWHAARCVRRDVAGINVETWIEAASEMRRIRGEQADFNANVVRDAVEAIEAVGRSAADREGIANPTLTSDQIDHVERTALLGFSIPDPIAEAAAEDIDSLLAGGIPVTGTAGPPQSPVEPKMPRARRSPELIQDNSDDTDDSIFDFED